MAPRSDPLTLLETLERRARRRPLQTAYLFEQREHTLGDLWGSLDRFAAGLVERGASPGDRAVLVLPNGPEFFAAFYGCQRAGVIPVPLYPDSGLDRVLDLASACGASWVVLASDGPREPLDAGGARSGRKGPVFLRGSEVDASPAGVSFPPPEPESLALLQYTSGSTGDPKGVEVTHAQLSTNVRQMIAGLEIGADEVFVSWLPVHHDMGLVLMTMVPFYLGARLVLLPSSLTDVRRWTAAIAAHRGTFTAAPDFAYRLCLRSIRQPSRFDLSSLRVALDAAEPVREATLRGFEEAFGLDRVMIAGYGLAEATVGVSAQPPGTSPVISDHGLVAIGRPFPEVSIDLVAEGRPVRPGEIGELVVESPANTRGYFADPDATATLFDRPGWIRTGDLGFRDPRGEVFVVGRSKNIILQAGRNLAPHEIEETVERLDFVRCAAAVGIDRGRLEGEQAYVFVELRRAVPPPVGQLEEMATEVVDRFYRRLGVRPGRVCLVPPRTIPRTSNGKIRHAALRAVYLDGTLQAQGRILFPAQPKGQVR